MRICCRSPTRLLPPTIRMFCRLQAGILDLWSWSSWRLTWPCPGIVRHLTYEGRCLALQRGGTFAYSALQSQLKMPGISACSSSQGIWVELLSVEFNLHRGCFAYFSLLRWFDLPCWVWSQALMGRYLPTWQLLTLPWLAKSRRIHAKSRDTGQHRHWRRAQHLSMASWLLIYRLVESNLRWGRTVSFAARRSMGFNRSQSVYRLHCYKHRVVCWSGSGDW